MVAQFDIGEILRLRKSHTCGGYRWEVVRLGADIGIRCTTCDRRLLMSRSNLEKRIKTREIVSEIDEHN